MTPLGGRVGGCVQHPLQHPPQIFVQAGEIHALPVEQGEHLVRQGLEVGHIAGQTADEQTDAVRHLGEHKGEQGGDHHHQSHIGGQHCQRTAEAVQLPPRQPPVVQPEKEGAGPVEHECDGKPEEQGLQRPQDLSRHGPYQVDLHQYQHQHHRVGDDQKDASQQIFVQRCPSLRNRICSMAKIPPVFFHYIMPRRPRQHPSCPSPQKGGGPQPRV